MSSNEKAPQKVWLEYYPDEHFLYLTDELVWTGCMTEYVRSDYYDRLREALDGVVGGWTTSDDVFGPIQKARTLLAALEAEKGGE